MSEQFKNVAKQKLISMIEQGYLPVGTVKLIKPGTETKSDRECDIDSWGRVVWNDKEALKEKLINEPPYNCNDSTCKPCKHTRTKTLCPGCDSLLLVLAPGNKWLYCPNFYTCEFEMSPSDFKEKFGELEI